MWINCKEDERKKDFDELLKYVEYADLTTSFVEDYLYKESLLLERLDIMTDIRKALDSRQLLIVRRASAYGENVLLKYHPKHNRFTACKNPFFPIGAAAVTVHKNKVYAAGGWSDRTHMQVYDVLTDTWTMRPTVLDTTRRRASVTVLKDKLYLIGGRDWKLYDRPSVETYCISKDGNCTEYTGPQVPPVKNSRWFQSIVTRGDEIFVLGGCDDDGNDLSSVEVLHTTKFLRYDLPAMQQSRYFTSAVLFNDCLVAIGGHSEGGRLCSVESYSFETKTWFYLPHMNFAREGHSSCVFDGCIYTVGGNGRNDIEIFDSVTWTVLKTYRTIGRCWSVSVVISSEFE